MGAAAAETLQALANAGAAPSPEFRGESRVVVPREKLRDVFSLLKDKRGFDLLVDVTCVDYLAYRNAEGDGPEHRFGLVYLLTNVTTNERLTMRVFVDEPDLVVPSACGWWEGANWMEREVWDMFGITFDGHPDHRRILCPDEFTAHPLRKDYPLQGRGERHNFPVLSRNQA
jgi:NADH-quinone oxidoreductase subunit C